MNRQLRCVRVGMLLMLAGSSASAATLRGTVTLSFVERTPEDTSIPAYPGMLGTVAARGTAAPTATPRDVVLYVVPSGDAPARVPAMKASAKHPELRQIGQRFQPHVLGIPVGTTVDFPNADPVFHNVFSYSKAKRFDLGKYGQGKTKSVTFDRAGIVKVFCEIHSDMTAFIVVVDTPWIQQPDVTGRFEFPDLPAGTYELHVWHPNLEWHARIVELGEDEVVVDLKF